MTAAPRFVSHGLTHVGLVRQRNEDAFIERPEHGIWAVADGMGGHEQGDYASAAVVNRLAAFKPFADLEEFTDEVRRALAHVDVHLWARAKAAGPQTVIASTVAITNSPLKTLPNSRIISEKVRVISDRMLSGSMIRVGLA